MYSSASYSLVMQSNNEGEHMNTWDNPLNLWKRVKVDGQWVWVRT